MSFVLHNISDVKTPFSQTAFKANTPTQLQSHPNICGFYTIYAAFHPSSFVKKEKLDCKFFLDSVFTSNHM